jgi:hypothetical protein
VSWGLPIPLPIVAGVVVNHRDLILLASLAPVIQAQVAEQVVDCDGLLVVRRLSH